LQGSGELVVALNDDAPATADDVQLSVNVDGREQHVQTTKLNSRTLTFMAPSKPGFLADSLIYCGIPNTTF